MTTLVKQQSSGLSSKIKARDAAPQSQEANQQTYTFSIDVTIQDKIQVPKTEVVIANDMKLIEASKIALQKIKLQLEAIGVFVSADVQKYKPRLARKNGKAKSLDYEQFLIDMKIKAICLDPKDQTCVHLILTETKQPKQSTITFQKPFSFVVEDKKGNEILVTNSTKQNFQGSPYAAPPTTKEIPPASQQPKCFCLLF